MPFIIRPVRRSRGARRAPPASRLAEASRYGATNSPRYRKEGQLRLRIAVSSLSLVAFLALGLPAQASPAGPRLQTLARDMTFIWAKEHPLFATALGLSDEDGDLDIPTETTRAHDLAQVRAWRATLAKIPLVDTAN